MVRTAFTLAETLVVLALAGIALLVLPSLLRASLAADAAQVAALLRSSRHAAVLTGSMSPQCVNTSGVHVRAEVVSWPPRGLMFTPDGLPRTCDGGGVGNTTILLKHRGRQAAVIVSSLGRVRWELR